MIFKKKKKTKSIQPQFAGERKMTCIADELLNLEAELCDVVSLDQSAQPWNGQNIKLATGVECAQNCAAAIGYAQGAAASGLRSALVSSAGAPAEFAQAVTDAVNKHLPIVFHLTLHDSSLLQQILESGAIVLYASDLQAASDLAVIGHAAAEQALLPCVVFNDVDLLGRIEEIARPTQALLQTYNGSACDLIESPTPSQSIAFGEKRRRIPRFCDLDQPAGLWAEMDSHWQAQSNAANAAFFAPHRDEILQGCCREFAKLTGRNYWENRKFSAKNAANLILAQGAVFRDASRLAEYLVKKKKGACNVLHLNHFSAASWQDLQQEITSVEKITIIEKSAKSGSHPGRLTSHVQQKIVASNQQIKFITAVDASGDGNLSFAELAALASGAQNKETVYLGVNFRQPDLRLPKLEMLQQAIQKDYPDVSELGVNPAAVFSNAIGGQSCLILQQDAFDTQLSIKFCDAISSLKKGQIEAGKKSVSGDPAIYFNYFTDTADIHSGEKLLVCRGVDKLVELIRHEKIADGGTVLLVDSDTEIELPKSVIDQLQASNIKLHTVATAPQQASGSLLGALARLFDLGDKKLNVKVKKHFIASATATQGEAFKAGYEGVKKVKYKQIAAADQPEIDEIEAPWTVRNGQETDGSLFDLDQFWSRIGYLQAEGQRHNISADPFAAVPSVPAGSSAFKHGARLAGEIVQFIPENLPADNLEFLQAFDSGVWASVQDLATIIDTAMTIRQNSGAVFSQLPRLRDNLAKLAYKRLKTDLIDNFCFAGDLFDHALVSLLEKMKPAAEQKLKIEEEYGSAIACCRKMILLKNQYFFDQAEAEAKGSGRVIVLAINPAEYRSGRLLINSLPELAAEVVPVTKELLHLNEQNWQFLQAMPIVPLCDLDCERSPWHSLLNKNVRAAIMPFNNNKARGVQTALQLLTVAIERTMQQRVVKLRNRIDDLQQKIENKIQSDLNNSSKINDFEAYGQRLNALLAKGESKAEAARLAASEFNNAPDAEQIQALVSLREQLVQLNRAYANENNGFGRANALLAIDSRLAIQQFPDNALKSPWLQINHQSLASSMDGLFAGLVSQMSETFLILRRAEKRLANNFTELPASLSWQEFTDDEKSCFPPVVGVFSGMYSSADMSDLSALTMAGKPYKFVFMRRDPRRHHRTALLDTALTLNSCFFNNSFVSQMAIGMPENLLINAADAIAFPGAAILQIDANEAQSTAASYELSQLAVETRFAPLFTSAPAQDDLVLPGLDISANSAVDEPWVVANWVQRHPDGLMKPVQEALTPAHYLARLPQFADQFEEFAPASIDERSIQLVEFLKMPASDRQGRQPYIRSIDAGQKLCYLHVKPSIIAVCSGAVHLWTMLQKLAQPVRTDALPEAANGDVFSAVEKQELENRIQQLEQDSDQVMHAKLKNRLLDMSGFAAGSSNFHETLRSFLAGLAKTTEEN